jgi:NAD(P)-dependent dehydrogenase (short-subunit alcohol dehydrogenase family)
MHRSRPDRDAVQVPGLTRPQDHHLDPSFADPTAHPRVAHTIAKATGVDPETARKNVLASIGGLVTGRLTRPEKVATLVLLRASPRTANVTGSNYLIDGGLIKTT